MEAAAESTALRRRPTAKRSKRVRAIRHGRLVVAFCFVFVSSAHWRNARLGFCESVEDDRAVRKWSVEVPSTSQAHVSKIGIGKSAKEEI